MMKNYTAKKIWITSPGGRMKLLVLQPKKQVNNKTPGILWIHGGGYAVGMAGMVYMSRALNLVKKYGAVVVSPEYRLAGKAAYPAALQDCYAALKYMREHAEKLGFDADKLIVGGESAGGGLTAALCMYARDQGEVKIACQLPLYPMIDDRDTPSSRDNHGISWNTKRNHAAWELYLRDITGDAPPYAAPARQTDYTGLPPCYTFVGDSEPFYCETLNYAENLRKAGVKAEVDVYPDWYHAYDLFFPFTRKGKAAIAAFEDAFLRAIKKDSR